MITQKGIEADRSRAKLNSVAVPSFEVQSPRDRLRHNTETVPAEGELAIERSSHGLDRQH